MAINMMETIPPTIQCNVHFFTFHRYVVVCVKYNQEHQGYFHLSIYGIQRVVLLISSEDFYLMI